MLDGIEYRPPAASGDLLSAAQDGAPVIGLVDGVFHQSLAVSPREVHAAAAAGARLFGGASMGALRAVDCPGVMAGIGEVYEAFASGELTDDDEVAVTCDPATWEIASYPLVQVRAAAGLLAARWPTARPALQAFIERIRALPFTERTDHRLAQAADELAGVGIRWHEVSAALVSDASDVKRRDALAVIAAVRAAWLALP
jgi:TfuA protein